MANKAVLLLTAEGEELYTLRKAMDDLKASFDITFGQMAERKEALQKSMMGRFHKLGLASIKLPSGDTVALAKRRGIEIKSEPHALAWAKENGCVSINRTLVAQKLKDTDRLPASSGLEMVEHEYISVRKPKAKASA